MDYQPEILMQFPYFVLITKHFICDNLQMYDSWIDVFPPPDLCTDECSNNYS